MNKLLFLEKNLERIVAEVLALLSKTHMTFYNLLKIVDLIFEYKQNYINHTTNSKELNHRLQE